jgi:hypothetical protein
MALKYAPTLVIGLKGGNGQAMEGVLGNVRFWLSEYYPQVVPIVKFGMADENHMTERIGEPVGDGLVSGLRSWLETIAETRRLEKVREQGIEIVGVERLNRRVILLLQPDCLHQPALSVLKGLSEASSQFEAGVQVLAMVIVSGERPDLSSLPLQEWQNAAQGLSFARIVVVHRYRSDGSTVDEASLPVVLQFLLLSALAPYESEGHWLFESYGSQPTLNTVGIGLLYVPVAQIAEAAGNYLAFQLSAQGMGEQPHPKQTEWERELAQIFDENSFWQSLFAGLRKLRRQKLNGKCCQSKSFKFPSKRVSSADEALQAIEQEINSVLREMGLQLLLDIQRNFLRRVSEVAEANRETKKGMERLRENWKAKAQSFDAKDTTMTRAVIRSGSKLQPIIDERMKGQNWLELWQQALKQANIQTFAEWCDRIKDGKAELKIAEATENLWREKWQGKEMQRLSFYLRPHENEGKTK